MKPHRGNGNPTLWDSTMLAAIVESSDDAIIGKALDGTITSWNRGAEEIYGYTAAEMLGKSINLLSPPDHVDEVPEFLDRIRQGRHVQHYETVRVRKDGKRINVALTISPIKDQAGQIIGASSIARDITERKRIEEERLRLAAIVDSSDDAILGMTLDGTVISWNRGAEKMLGFTGDEIIGKSIRLIYPPDRPDELPEIVAKMKRGGGGALTTMRPSGSTRTAPSLTSHSASHRSGTAREPSSVFLKLRGTSPARSASRNTRGPSSKPRSTRW